MISPTSQIIVTPRAIVLLLNPAITISRGHHNPSIPSPSGFPSKTCQFLHTMIIFTTPLNEQVGVFHMRDLIIPLRYENHPI